MLIGYELALIAAFSLSLVFTGEFVMKSISIIRDIGITLVVLTFLVILAGLCLILRSIFWQVSFNQRRALNLLNKSNYLAKASLMKDRSATKKLTVVAEDDEDEDDESVSGEEDMIKIRAKQRRQFRQRKLDAIASEPPRVNNIELDSVHENTLSDFEQEISRLEKLTGLKNDKIPYQAAEPVDQEAQIVLTQQVQGAHYDASRPSSPAESSYSDFMSQWKNKLNAEGGDKATGEQFFSDAVSNYSAQRSNYSLPSHVESPQVGLQKVHRKQSSMVTLGVNDSQGVIHEEVYEDSADSDADGGGVILSKAERRRLNNISAANRDGSQGMVDYSSTRANVIGAAVVMPSARKEEEQYDLL